MRKRILEAAVMATVLSSSTLVFGLRAGAGSSDPVRIGAPAYFTDAPSWTRLLAMPGLSHVIVNAYDSGTVSAISGYVNQANVLGVKTLGYSAAGFSPAGSPNSGAARTLPALQSQVQTVFTAYPTLGGLFLDEIQNTNPCEASWVQFYQDFSTWFRGAYPGKTLAFNPGGPLCAAFAGTADIYVMAERSAANYNSAISYYADAQFDWIRSLPNSQVWVMNYATPESSAVPQIDNMSTVLGAGVVWTTDGATTNDYALLPSAQYLCVLSQRAMGTSTCSTSSTTTTTTTTTTTSSTTTLPTAATAATSTTTTQAVTAVAVNPNTAAAPAPTTTTTVTATTVTATTATTTAVPPTTSVAVTTTTRAATTTIAAPAPSPSQPTAVTTAAVPEIAPAAEARVGAPAFTG